MRPLLAVLLALASPFTAARAQDAPAPDAPAAPLAAPAAAEVAAAIEKTAAFLVLSQERYDPEADVKQRREGNPGAAKEAAGTTAPPAGREWPYEGVYLVRGAIPSGYRVGGTAIVCWALLEIPGFDGDQERQAAFRRGIDFILEAFDEDPLLDYVPERYKGGYDVRGWAHAYALHALLRVLKQPGLEPALVKRVRARVQWLVKALEETEIEGRGGWNYARQGRRGSPSTFMTAPTLQALFQAESQGFPVREDVVTRALDSLEEARLESGAFQYGSNPTKVTGKGFEAVPGACARMAVAETTLLLAGRGSVDRVRAAVLAFFEHWQHLEDRRAKKLTHEPPYMIAPYYFHYAHTYVAQAIEQLPEAERPPLREKLQALYWKTRDGDGTWNDRVFPRSAAYSSAMVALGLLMPRLEPPAPWARAGKRSPNPR